MEYSNDKSVNNRMLQIEQSLYKGLQKAISEKETARLNFETTRLKHRALIALKKEVEPRLEEERSRDLDSVATKAPEKPSDDEQVIDPQMNRLGTFLDSDPQFVTFKTHKSNIDSIVQKYIKDYRINSETNEHPSENEWRTVTMARR